MESRFCTSCGAGLNPDGTCSNPDCVNARKGSNRREGQQSRAFSKDTGYSSPKYAQSENVSGETGKRIVPDCVNADDGEIPIRQYDIARLRSPFKLNFAEGRLQVTNKRILFRTSGRSLIGPTSSQYEFAIEEVAGVELHRQAHFNFISALFWLVITFLAYEISQNVFSVIGSWGFISSVVMILFAVISLSVFLLLKGKAEIRHIILSLTYSYVLATQTSLSSLLGARDPGFLTSTACTIIFACFLINLFCVILAPNLMIFIRTKGGSPSIEIQRKKVFGIVPQEGTGFSQVMPGPDFDKAEKELGALIREIQHSGNAQFDS